MVPVGEKPILEIILRQLARAGFTDVSLSVGYLSELIRAYFDRPRDGLETLSIDYVYEDEPTGTAGALKLVADLNETFLLMNGDVLTTMPLETLIDYHRQQGATLTIATHERGVNIDLGILETNESDRVTGYIEKPTLNYRVSMGVYVLEPQAVEVVPQGAYFDFPDLVHALLDAGHSVAAYPCKDFWLDIGRPEDYERAQQEIENRREAFGL